MKITQSDIDICARTIYGEARGEGYIGQMAVAHVMINRWKSAKGQFAKDDSLATACLRHYQFSTWNKDDVNFDLMFEIDCSDQDFLRCQKAVLDALLSGHDNITRGSLHYHNSSITPRWVENHFPAVTIGHHKFYNDIK